MHTVQAGERIALKNVLFATDFSPNSNAALPYALSVVRRYRAMLFAVHVKPTDAEILFTAPENWPSIADSEEKRVQEYVQELETQLLTVPHDVLTPKGNVPDTLVQIIAERDIDLLVLGTHGRSGFGKLVLGSVAEEIFRRTACPVLSVGPKVSRKPGEEIQFRRILFATDFSQDSLAALPYAVSLAEEDQAHLTLLHVVEQPAAGVAELEEVKSALSHRLKELIPTEAELWCDAECLVEFGRQFTLPAHRILEVAGSQAADLIILGARPLLGKMGLLTHFASTTAQILTQALCPVLTIHANIA